MKRWPDYLEKRNLLHSPRTRQEELRSWGDVFFEGGWWNDAVDFYEKAKYREGLEAIGKVSVEMGDFFLFRRTVDLLKREVSKEEWEALGDRARAKGRLQDAWKAFRMGGLSSKVQEVEREIESERESQSPFPNGGMDHGRGEAGQGV